MENVEDENPTSNLGQTMNSTETLDTATQKKHAAMLHRLSHRSSSSSASRNLESERSSPSFESTASFLARFNQSRLSIESHLARCKLAASDPNSGLKSDLDKVSISITEFERLVAENSYFLPSYEVRSSLKAVSDLKQTLESLNSELLPKKKFAFRKKNTKNAKKEEQEEMVGLSKAAEAVKCLEHEKLNLSKVSVRQSPGFRNVENASLLKKFGGFDSGSEVGEFVISDLSGCQVRLTGCVRALFIHHLRNCRVYAGPVFGSVLIEDVEDCVFVLASHQIRIHHAKGTDFYLRVRSRPIIEDTSSVRFAPYCLSYERIDQDLQEANLNEETGNWANVDDFKWLRAVQSPNWSILPENERIGAITVSNSGIGLDGVLMS